MATLKQIANVRRAEFREILKLSRELDAAQEAVEREIKRITTRKGTVPETTDAERVLKKLTTTGERMDAIATKFTALLRAWNIV